MQHQEFASFVPAVCTSVATGSCCPTAVLMRLVCITALQEQNCTERQHPSVLDTLLQTGWYFEAHRTVIRKLRPVQMGNGRQYLVQEQQRKGGENGRWWWHLG